ncbi:MAG: hypothetical protein V4548_09355 [Bacteroidota bacterium]
MKKVLFVAAVFLSIPASYGQEVPEPPPPTPPPGLPIDGGIMALLFVSIFFGLYKIHQHNSKKTPV